MMIYSILIVLSLLLLLYFIIEDYSSIAIVSSFVLVFVILVVSGLSLIESPEEKAIKHQKFLDDTKGCVVKEIIHPDFGKALMISCNGSNTNAINYKVRSGKTTVRKTIFNLSVV